MPNKSLSFLGVLLLSAAFIATPVLAQEANSELEPPKVLDEASKKMLEQELGDVSTESKTVVDFPARSNLGEVELAPLPGINEQMITGPASMEPSLSPKDL